MCSRLLLTKCSRPLAVHFEKAKLGRSQKATFKILNIKMPVLHFFASLEYTQQHLNKRHKGQYNHHYLQISAHNYGTDLPREKGTREKSVIYVKMSLNNADSIGVFGAKQPSMPQPPKIYFSLVLLG